MSRGWAAGRMQRWRLLGVLWGCLLIGAAVGSSLEKLQAGGLPNQLAPIGSRAASARRGGRKRGLLQAELKQDGMQDLFLSTLRQKGAAAATLDAGKGYAGNVLVDAPRYHSNAELQEYLEGYLQRCGHIASLEQFGNSTLGNPLWVLEISDHPGEREAEPAFKFVANMHGDEPSGRELVLYLAEWLCQNHRNDSQAARIVEHVHLFLVPSLNPDGFQRRQRGNANGIDLNRDFPDQYFANNNDLAMRQAETRALMEWTLSRGFTAGASLHEGAVVANYPWDGSTDQGTHYAESPDDAAFRHLATAYARGHTHMWNSSEFAGGITNGAAWYPLYGGMQDWNYLQGGCLDITIEVNDNKWPPAEKLPLLWSEHKGAMLGVLDVVAQSGLHGSVTSALDEKPLSAQIDVEGAGRPVWTRMPLGDFHRVLAPGTYLVHVAAPGYMNVTANATVTVDAPTILDFRLTPDPEQTPSSRAGGMLQGDLRGTSLNRTQSLLGVDNTTWGQAELETRPRIKQILPTRGEDAQGIRARRLPGGGSREEAGLPQLRREEALAWPREGGVSRAESELRGDEMRQVAGELMQAKLRGAQGQRGIPQERQGGGVVEREEEEEEDEEERLRGEAVTREKLAAAKGAFDEKDDRKRTGDFGQGATWRDAEGGGLRSGERQRVQGGVGDREEEAEAFSRLQAAAAEGGEREAEEELGAEDVDEVHHAEEVHRKHADENKPFLLGTGSFPGSPDIEQTTLDSYYAGGGGTWNHLTAAMAVVFTFMLLILWSWLRGRRSRGWTPRGRPIRVTRVPQIGGPGLFRD